MDYQKKRKRYIDWRKVMKCIGIAIGVIAVLTSIYCGVKFASSTSLQSTTEVDAYVVDKDTYVTSHKSGKHWTTTRHYRLTVLDDRGYRLQFNVGYGRYKQSMLGDKYIVIYSCWYNSWTNTRWVTRRVK